MRRETVNLGTEYGAEYAGKYVFQELTWARRSRIIQKHTRYHPITGQVVSSDFIAIQAETIWASLKEQPQSKPITLEKLLGEENGVPIALGELFSRIANSLCAMTQEETAFLSAQSDADSRTQQSPASASAKSSDGPQQSSAGSQPEPSTSSPSSSTR
ncbi:hypothetical protein G4O51_05190 [Candidatus Bathyarchaeota archaeon A05DMB-2]|nr:hypothetical protein [Candidatus Bathyarchaeota archaeon A05DMB-2]